MPEQKPTTDAPPASPVAEAIGDPVTAEQFRAAVAKEYGTYIALGPIDFDGVRAYNTGDPVPAANVDRWGYLDRGFVARRSTKAAAGALEVAAQDPGRR